MHFPNAAAALKYNDHSDQQTALHGQTSHQHLLIESIHWTRGWHIIILIIWRTTSVQRLKNIKVQQHSSIHIMTRAKRRTNKEIKPRWKFSITIIRTTDLAVRKYKFIKTLFTLIHFWFSLWDIQPLNFFLMRPGHPHNLSFYSSLSSCSFGASTYCLLWSWTSVSVFFYLFFLSWKYLA